MSQASGRWPPGGSRSLIVRAISVGVAGSAIRPMSTGVASARYPRPPRGNGTDVSSSPNERTGVDGLGSKRGDRHLVLEDAEAPEPDQTSSAAVRALVPISGPLGDPPPG